MPFGFRKAVQNLLNKADPERVFEVGDYVKMKNGDRAGKVQSREYIEKYGMYRYIIQIPAVSRQYLEKPNLNISDKDGIYYVLTTTLDKVGQPQIAFATKEDVDGYIKKLREKYNAKTSEEIRAIYNDLENNRIKTFGQ